MSPGPAAPGLLLILPYTGHPASAAGRTQKFFFVNNPIPIFFEMQARQTISAVKQ